MAGLVSTAGRVGEIAMTKRRAAWAGVAIVVALALVGGLLWLALPGDTVTQEDFDRIAIGMTLPEVEGVFGQPADSVFQMQPRFAGAEKGSWLAEGHEMRYWNGSAWYAYVVFDKNGQVIRKERGRWNPPPWYQRLAKRLGL
jgi:hypothetical protein